MLKFENGDIYTGEIKGGKPDGHGKMVYCSQNMTYYVGQWKDGKRDGEGTTYSCKGEKKYEGSWREDQFDGNGIFYDQFGSVYKEGKFNSEQRCWSGRYYQQYFGTRVKIVGQFCDQGTPIGDVEVYNMDDRKIYEGGWNGHAKHNVGIEYYPNGDKLKCQWSNGGIVQPGTYFYANGDIYEGEHSLEKLPHGKGTMTWADGSKFVGKFENGSPVTN